MDTDDVYRRAVLEALVALGGAASTEIARARAGVILDPWLSAEDRVDIPSGGQRWRKRAEFSRLQLVKLGLMDGSRRGVWTITPAGRDALTAGTYTGALARRR